jgi:hypothetical protein
MTPQTVQHETFLYEVDAGDVLRRVERTSADDTRVAVTVGDSLWDHVEGQRLRQFYHFVLAHVRRTGATVRIPFRCDAPECRRDMLMVVEPLPDRGVRFSTSLVDAQPRAPLRLLATDAPRSGEIQAICSMCLALALPDGSWVPLEEGVERLGLLRAGDFPRLSHGMCDACFQREMAALETSVAEG